MNELLTKAALCLTREENHQAIEYLEEYITKRFTFWPEIFPIITRIRSWDFNKDFVITKIMELGCDA